MTDQATGESIEDLVAKGGAAERRLLRRERRAEREVAEARSKLAKDEARFERARLRLEIRRGEAAAAEDALRARQRERADGPSAPDRTTEPLGDSSG